MTAGRITLVGTDPDRVFLAAPAGVGDTTLTVLDGWPLAAGAADGDRATGLVIAGELYTLVTYTEGADEDTPATITISPGLATAVPEDEPVALDPPMTSTYAFVAVDGMDESVKVRVPQQLQDAQALSLGPRGTVEEQEPVQFEDLGNGPELTWVDGRLVRDATFLDPGTIPPPPASDGFPPSSSPVPIVRGGIGSLFVVWETVANDDPTVYRVHMSTTSGFAPSPLTLVGQSGVGSAGPLVARALPDGTPLVAGTTYYVVITAADADGEGPPSAQAEGSPSQITGPDIAVNSVTSDMLTSNSVTAEKLSSIMTFSALFRTAEVGQRGEWDVDSLRFYDTSDRLTTRISGTDSFFSGDASIGNLETRAATLGGHTLGPSGGDFRIGSSTIPAPTLPLDHVSVAAERREVMATNLKYITPSDSSDMWRTALDPQAPPPSDGGPRPWVVRLGPPTGTGTGIRFTSTDTDPVVSAAISTGVCFAHVGAGRIVSLPRTPAAEAIGYEVATLAAPGVGGYAAGDPVIGTQKTTGQLLVAHRVQGDQTIDGLAFSHNEVMVRKYTIGGTAAAPTLTLNRTVGLGLIADGPVSAVLMDNTSGVFDMPASAGNTGLTVSSTVGFAPYSVNVFTALVPDAGPTTTPTAGWAGGAFGWYDTNSRGVLWDGSAFWTTDPSGDAIRRYTSSPVAAPVAYHSYTYWDGAAQETMQSPRYAAPVLARHVSKWTIPALPAGVTRARIYIGAEDTRARMERVGSFTGTELQPLKVTQDPIEPPDGDAVSPPPAASNLSNGTSYRIFDDLGNEWDGATGFEVVAPTLPAHPANKGYVDDARWSVAEEKHLFVSPRGSDANDGLDWAHPKLTLGAVVGAADVVNVGPGSLPVPAGVSLSSGTVVKGSGKGVTTLAFTGSGAAFRSATPGERSYSHQFSDFTLAGPGKTEAGTIGFDLDSISEAVFKNVTVHTIHTSVKLWSAINGGATYNRFNNVKAQNCTYGYDIAASGSNGAEFEACRANACTTGVRITDSNNVAWFGGQIEGCDTGVYVDATSASLADSNMFTGVRFESNTLDWQTTALVRRFQMIYPQIFGAYTFTDGGTRTQHIREGVESRVSAVQQAGGSWRFERLANGGAGVPAMVVRDSNNSTGDPVTLQMETERASGWFARGIRAATRYFEITATGQGRFASLGVGNSAAATTPGTVVKKIQIFDAGGVSLGYLPVYDTIA